MNRIELFAAIKKNKPDLSDNSTKVYTTTLATLGNALGWTNPNFFTTKFKDVLAYLKTQPPRRAKQLSSALISYVKEKKSLKAYKDFILEVSEINRQNDEKQEKTPAQEENWESWSDIMKTYEQLKKEAYPLFSKDKPTPANMKTMRDLVILAFYTLIPPRRIQDYIDFKIKDAMEDGEEDESEVIVDAETEKMESSQLDALKAAIHDVLFAFEAHAKEIADLKADLQAFKKEAKHNPLKEDTLMSNAFSGDRRYEILRQMKENNRK